jgi:hypothetical protein
MPVFASVMRSATSVKKEEIVPKVVPTQLQGEPGQKVDAEIEIEKATEQMHLPEEAMTSEAVPIDEQVEKEDTAQEKHLETDSNNKQTDEHRGSNKVTFPTPESEDTFIGFQRDLPQTYRE